MKVYPSKSKVGVNVFQAPVFHEIGVDELVLALRYGLDTKKVYKLSQLSRQKLLDLAKEGFECWGGQFRMYTNEGMDPQQKAMGTVYTREHLKSKVKSLFPELL